MTEAKGDDRGARLKAALRENLKRRKAQERGRRPADPAEDPPPTAPANSGRT